MKLTALLFVLLQLACSASCLTNNINLTIYNNLNYTIAIADIVHNGNCDNCQESLVGPCKSEFDLLSLTLASPIKLSVNL